MSSGWSNGSYQIRDVTLSDEDDSHLRTKLYWNGAIANEPFRGGRSTSDIICIVEPHADSADPVE